MASSVAERIVRYAHLPVPTAEHVFRVEGVPRVAGMPVGACICRMVAIYVTRLAYERGCVIIEVVNPVHGSDTHRFHTVNMLVDHYRRYKVWPKPRQRLPGAAPTSMATSIFTTLLGAEGDRYHAYVRGSALAPESVPQPLEPVSVSVAAGTE